MHQVSDSLSYPTVHLQHLVFTNGTAKKVTGHFDYGFRISYAGSYVKS